MSELTTKQPAGTPTWIDLGIPDLDRAMTFYGALFGWEFDVGPAEFGHYTQCLLRGRPVAAIRPNPDPDATDFWWNVYFATDDCDAAAARARDAGGSIITGPMDVLDQGRTAIIKDTTGAQCGLWQAGAHIGCEIVNEPNALLRNDLVTAESGPARDFYVAVFGYTLDANPDMPELDFTFLRRLLLNAISNHVPTAILPDELRGGRETVDLLLAAGHREDIVVIGRSRAQPPDEYYTTTVQRRFEGIWASLHAHNVKPLAEVACQRWYADEGYAGMRDLLASGLRPRAAICLNDRLAFGVYRALSEFGLKVPDDTSVVSFDDDEIAHYLHPHLTTAALPYDEMGTLAVQLLLDPAAEEREYLVEMPIRMRESVRI